MKGREIILVAILQLLSVTVLYKCYFNHICFTLTLCVSTETAVICCSLIFYIQKGFYSVKNI